MVTLEHLVKMKINSRWLDPLNQAFERANLRTLRQQGAFIGQCGHECNNFRTLQENLNYRPETLMRIWPSRFPSLEIAQRYNTPRLIANKVYGGRMGNRDEASGDGYRFRGRGCIQLTGYSNYFHAGKYLGVDLVADPDRVATEEYAALTAAWFWDVHKCNELAESGRWELLTKKINGGTIGLNDRIRHTNYAISVLSK